MSGERSTAREYLEALLIAGIFLAFTNTFLVKTFYIPSSSMEDTLLVGDHLFVNRFIYGPAPDGPLAGLLPHRAVERGDVVIFRSPEEPEVDMVKRCVGRDGDRVHLQNKRLHLNGRPVDESAFAINRDAQVYRSPVRAGPQAYRRDNFGPYTVPEQNLFCLGDNRDFSYDSRFFGPVPSHYVKGRALLIYWSYGGETPDGTWEGWGARIAQFLRTAAGFFTQTRWHRTFTLVR